MSILLIHHDAVRTVYHPKNLSTTDELSSRRYGETMNEVCGYDWQSGHKRMFYLRCECDRQ